MLIKRIFDFLASGIGLIFLMPVFAVAAVCIKLDSPGPAIFRQQRVGLHGKAFRIYKFRTMRINIEMQTQLTIGKDARITRVGSFLRKYKIDELPQLLNVIRGEMSLVGPRPEVPRYVALYPDSLREKVLSVRPGITDLASVKFKNENDLLGASLDPEGSYVKAIMPIKLQYYERYVMDRSFFMDLKIIFITLISLVRA